MLERRSGYEYEDLLACGRGEMFGPRAWFESEAAHDGFPARVAATFARLARSPGLGGTPPGQADQ